MTDFLTEERKTGSPAMPSVLPNEQDFVHGAESGFAIYQLKDGPENHYLRFAGLAELREPVQKERYDLVYFGALPDFSAQETAPVLDGLYAEFNLFPPEDFRGHSLSVSDVIVLKDGDEFHAYYTDSIGFKPLDEFQPERNPLRSAEMAMEDDYDMIDGIINNGPKKDKEPSHDLKPDPFHHRDGAHRSDPER